MRLTDAAGAGVQDGLRVWASGGCRLGVGVRMAGAAVSAVAQAVRSGVAGGCRQTEGVGGPKPDFQDVAHPYLLTFAYLCAYRNHDLICNHWQKDYARRRLTSMWGSSTLWDKGQYCVR